MEQRRIREYAVEAVHRQIHREKIPVRHIAPGRTARHGRYVTFQMAEVAVPHDLSADWTLVAWTPLDDALPWASGLPRGRFQVTLKALEGFKWGIPDDTPDISS